MPKRSADITQACGSGIVNDVIKYRSRTEYLLPTDNIIVLDWHFNLTKKCNLIDRLMPFNTIYDNLIVAYILGHPVYRPLSNYQYIILYRKVCQWHYIFHHSFKFECKLGISWVAIIGQSQIFYAWRNMYVTPSTVQCVDIQYTGWPKM